MTPASTPPVELRATIRLTKNEIAHLWNGGILIKRVSAD
jgi:hypothetical protein